MAHISYTRQTNYSNRTDLNTIIPRDLELNNFAVFCGSLHQRLDTALHSISRYIGEVGIVVIHDTNDLNLRLSDMTVRANRPNVHFRSDTGKIYDPLYGLSSDAIVNLLAPMDTLNPLSHGISTLRSGILSYLQIMEYKFREHSGPFGNHPYNLDLLLQLCQMPYEVLNRTVLNYLPQNVASPIRTVLDTPDMQQNVLYCVNNLASMMSEYMWQYKGFAGHSGISIIDSVTNRGVISIRVPHSHPGILNYIDAELKMLEKRNVPFLLVNCSVDISQNPAMQSWFLNEREGKRYYTAIVADSLSSITDNDTQTSKLFSQYQQIIVFNCSGKDQAEPFSSQFGEYYRLETEYTVGTVRAPFKIFASHQQNTAERYVKERNVKTEDLIALGSGILLCGKAYQLPTIINNFTLNGGNNNGSFLSRLQNNI